MHADYLPHTVIIDCTRRARRWRRATRDWLGAGIHVVTPNKKANSGDYAAYQQLQHARRHGGTHYLYEATVGAGLPVVQTLRDLRETGDEITSIEGIFSGTLAYLFNVYDGSASFSVDRARGHARAATPSRIRATTCRAWTWRASSSSSRARWDSRSS